MKLPAAVGATRLQSAAIGAAVNPAINVAETAGIRALLQHANYEQIAQQYQPLDPLNLTISALVGAGFGAAFHNGKTKLPTGENPPASDAAPTSPTLTPDEHAAALTMHEVRVREGDALTKPGDIAAANAAKDGQDLARQQLDNGEQVSVAHMVTAEQAQLDAAYQRVLESPAGKAFDPIVHITPDDINGVVIARGGWNGRGDVEVKGAGWGLVKLIWKHGEESPKAPERQVTRDDVLNFPEIIRRFDPAEEATADGNRGRAWRVVRPDADGVPRVVTYADSLINGQAGRHLVTVHVLDDAHAKTAVLSKEKTGVDPESSGLILQSRAGDTAPGVLHSAGQETSVNAILDQNAAVRKVSEASGMADHPMVGRSQSEGTDAQGQPQQHAQDALTGSDPFPSARPVLFDGERRLYAHRDTEGKWTPVDANGASIEWAPKFNSGSEARHWLFQNAVDGFVHPPEARTLPDKIADTVSRILGREDAAPAAPDTQPAAPAIKADTPEQTAAFDMAARNPDMLIPTGEMDADGNPIRARAADLVRQTAEIEKQAQKESSAFAAASRFRVFADTNKNTIKLLVSHGTD